MRRSYYLAGMRTDRGSGHRGLKRCECHACKLPPILTQPLRCPAGVRDIAMYSDLEERIIVVFAWFIRKGVGRQWQIRDREQVENVIAIHE